MATIRFEFTTDDYYSDSDFESLKDSFRDVLQENDESADVIEASMLSVVSDGGSEVSDDERAKIIAEFVANAEIEYQVQARFKDENGKVIGDSVSATGTLD